MRPSSPSRQLKGGKSCAWSQVGQALDGVNPADEYGYAVDISNDGKTIITSSRLHEGDPGVWTGHVQVFAFDESTESWKQVGSDIEGFEKGHRYGFAVAISGDGKTVASGSLFTFGVDDGVHSGNGFVQVFAFDDDLQDWKQLGTDIVGDKETDLAAYSIKLSDDGSIVSIGSPWHTATHVNGGQVRVFKYVQVLGRWEQRGDGIEGSLANDQAGFAHDLSADGNTVAVGAPYSSVRGTGTGQLRVFRFNPVLAAWGQIGQDVYGETPGDQLGFAVSLSADGSTVAIGSNDANGDARGHVWVYGFDPDDQTWNLLGARIDGPQDRAVAGWAVAISADGTTVAYGAPLYGLAVDGGLVRVFRYQDSKWFQYGRDLVAESAEDQFGFAVSLSGDGDKLMVGAPMHSSNTTRLFFGRAYVYGLSETSCLRRPVEVSSTSGQDSLKLGLAIGIPVGLFGFLLLLWIIYLYVKRCRKWWRASVFPPPADPSRITPVDVFISHHGDDTKRILAKPLHFILKGFGVSSFFDEESIRKRHVVTDEIAAGVNSCKLGLIIISDNFLESWWCKRELNTLYSRQRPSGSANEDGFKLLLCFQSKKIISNPDYQRLKREGAIVRKDGVQERHHLAGELVKQVLLHFNVTYNEELSYALLDQYLKGSHNDALACLRRQVELQNERDETAEEVQTPSSTPSTTKHDAQFELREN